MLRLSVPWLALAAGGALVWTIGLRRDRTWWSVAGAVALWTSVAVAAGGQYRLGEIARDWATIRAEVEHEAAEAVATELDRIVDHGERAADGVIALAPDLETVDGREAAFSRLERLRRQSRMSALAVFGADGNPIVWAGQHRGNVPAEVRLGRSSFVFHRGPLFGYLYFAEPIPGNRTAVAAVLLESSVPVGADHTPFSERFAADHGVLPRFVAPDRAEGAAVWDWTANGPIFSVTFARVTQEGWHARTAERVRRGVAASGAVALLLLAFGWYRERAHAAGVPILITAAALSVAPLGAMFEARGLFSPLHFVVPGPVDVTLGQLLILLTGAALWVLIRGPSERWLPGVPGWIRVGLAGLAVAIGLEVVRRASSLELFSARPAGGLALIFAATLLTALPLFVLLRGPAAVTRRPPAPAIVAGVLLAGALALGLVLGWHPDRMVPVWVMAVWAAPFGLLLLGIRSVPRRWSTLAAWTLAGWLAGTASASFLWTQHLEARIDSAGAELAQLGTEPDPYLDYLLRQLAERAFVFASEGETGVNLLYRSWVASGLAREGYEARLTTWLGDQQQAELRFSDLELTDEMVAEMLPRARAAEEPLLERYTAHEEIHYLLLLPLPDNRVISVATPPRRRLGRATALARFLHTEEPTVAGAEYDRLSLVPSPTVASGEPALAEPHGVRWVRTRQGWRSEALVRFPAGAMHAHLQVVSPSAWMLTIRGLLVQVLTLVVFLLLWAAARTLCGDAFGIASNRWNWIRTFRGRLTLALFGFFLIPTLVLGAVAFGAFSQQVQRTGAALAFRSLELAAPEVALEPLSELGARVRADLLLYRDGGLVGASAPEVIDLGLFQSWLPRNVELAFATGEEIESLEEQRLAGNRYLVAYRRIGDDGVLAAPVPLASGEIARMQREFAHGFLLMMVLGAALSVVLALMVGRALSRPMERLGRATGAVGGGNLRVRLPEDRVDEFGGVYRSFNRMVRRLRRARADEARTARVLAWGEMARQVAHEIKNPLTPIKLSVQHLRRAYADGRPDFDRILESNVEAILREIDRLGRIARAFARFGAPREEAGTLEAVDLGRAVDETLVLYRGGKDDVRYRVDIDPAVGTVVARDGELREVLLNLLENAREAVDGGGQVTLRASPAGGGEWVQLDVADDGIGIPPDQLPKIFEPQFSTRSSGTGLGLAIVRRLVEAWGGEISATSEEGRGTTLHLRLRAGEGRQGVVGEGEESVSAAGAPQHEAD